MTIKDEKKLPPLRADETCLLIVDMQNDFVKPSGYFEKIGLDITPIMEMVPRASSFLRFCRENRLPRIFVKTMHYKFTTPNTWVKRLGDTDSLPSLCLPNTWGSEIIEELKPKADEPVITKHRYDAFFETDLQVILRTWKIKNLLVSGTTTNVCVDATVRHAFMSDYMTITLSDCVDTVDRGMQEPTLWNIANHFGYVKTSEEAKSKLVFDSDNTSSLTASHKQK